ncbi:MAG: M20 metallopeptidase family protein [Chitinophagales bacterium]
MKNKIQELISNSFEEIVDIRRHIHANPELSFKEYKTSQFIQQKLTEFGVPFDNNIAENGVVGYIRGKNPNKKVIALRADFDALPIQEENDVPYKSTKPGIMHACGHDAHTASLLGATKALKHIEGELEGTIKLIFQPAEERLPGGASLMIKEGVLENPMVSNILGQHVHPSMEVGKIGIHPGRFMASADEIDVTIYGKMGHGAMPHNAIDPILISSHIITGLQQIISRNCDPIIPSVLTFGSIQSSGGTYNIIPNVVTLKGTFRTMDEKWRFDAHKRMTKMAKMIAEGMGGKCDFHITVGYPFLINDVPFTQRCRQAAIEYLGKENVIDLPKRMTAEDFAYYTHETKGCFYRLGVGNVAKGITSGVHTPTFNIDESSLKVGAGLMAWLAVKELQAM